MKKDICCILTALLVITGCGAVDENIYYDYDEVTEDGAVGGNLPLPSVISEEEDFFDEETMEVTGEEETSIEVCLGEGIASLDPAEAYGIEEESYILHIFEGLMRYKASGKSVYGNEDIFYAKCVYGIASVVEVSEDQLTYTFSLRDDVYWSDGERVKAEDFVYSWRRLITPQNGFEKGDILNGIVKNATEIYTGEVGASALCVYADDEATFRVELEAPCPYFLRLTCDAALVPLRMDIMEGLKNPLSGAPIVTNGPFAVDHIDETGLFLAGNEKSHVAAASELLEFLFMDVDSAVDEFNAKRINFVADTYSDEMANVTDKSAYRELPGTDTTFLTVNRDRIRDYRVVLAMALAIDRDALCDRVFEGAAMPLYGMVPRGITSSSKKDYSESFFPEGALINAAMTVCPDADLSTCEGRCALFSCWNNAGRRGLFHRMRKSPLYTTSTP